MRAGLFATVMLTLCGFVWAAEPPPAGTIAPQVTDQTDSVGDADPNRPDLEAAEPGVILQLQLLDAQGAPLNNVALAPASIGYDPALPKTVHWPDKKGSLSIDGIRPGRHLWLANTDRLNPTLVQTDVPREGLKQNVTIETERQAASDLDVKVQRREEQGRLLLDVTITNNLDEPYALSESDLAIISSDWRAFPPASQQKKDLIVPARGKGEQKLTLDWDVYLKQGLWCRRTGEAMSWTTPAEPPPPGQQYFRVKVGIAESLPVALPLPLEDKDARSSTQPTAAEPALSAAQRHSPEEMLAKAAAGELSLTDLRAAVEAAWGRREELLLRSSGKVDLAIVAESNAGGNGSATATVDWYQKGNKRRYDLTVVPRQEEPPEGQRRYASLRDHRVAVDPEKELDYDVTANVAYIRTNHESSNPYGLMTDLRIARLYEFNSASLPDLLAIVEKEKTPNLKIARERVGELDCIRVDEQFKDRSKTRWTFWIAPAQGYSLVKGELYITSTFNPEERTEEKLYESYSASYEQSAEGTWILKEAQIASYGFGLMPGEYINETLVAKVLETRLGVDVPNETFTFEGLGVPEGTSVQDERFQFSYKKKFPNMGMPQPRDPAMQAAAITLPIHLPHTMSLVIGVEKITFEGQETTWEHLPTLLDAVEQPGQKMLEVSAGSHEVTMGKYADALAKARELARFRGFGYLHDAGLTRLSSQ